MVQLAGFRNQLFLAFVLAVVSYRLSGGFLTSGTAMAPIFSYLQSQKSVVVAAVDVAVVVGTILHHDEYLCGSLAIDDKHSLCVQNRPDSWVGTLMHYHDSYARSSTQNLFGFSLEP